MRPVPSWYYKEQLPSLKSTQIVFFDELHIQKVSEPPTASKYNKQNIRFPRYEYGNIDVKRGKYETNNQPKKATLKYEQEGILCLGVAKIAIKEETITGN